MLNIHDYISSTARLLADVAIHFDALIRLSIRTARFYSETHAEIIPILALLTPALSSFDADEGKILSLLESLTLTREHSSHKTNDPPVSPACADALCDMLELRYPSHSTPPRLSAHTEIFPGIPRRP